MGVYNIVPLFLVDEKAMGIDFANQIFGLSRIGGFVGQAGIGWFLDRYSTKKIMFVLVLASGLSTLGVALIQVHWLFVSMLLLQGTFSVVFFPVGIMAISKLADLNERSIYTGNHHGSVPDGGHRRNTIFTRGNGRRLELSNRPDLSGYPDPLFVPDFQISKTNLTFPLFFHPLRTLFLSGTHDKAVCLALISTAAAAFIRMSILIPGHRSQGDPGIAPKQAQ